MPNKASSSTASGGKYAMSGSDASRIQATQDKAGHDMSSGGFAARAQAGAAAHTNQASTGMGMGLHDDKGAGYHEHSGGDVGFDFKGGGQRK